MQRRNFFAALFLPAIAAIGAAALPATTRTTSKKCGSCKHLDLNDLTCRRYPPPESGGKIPPGTPLFPIVTVNDYCGEYVPR